MIDATFLDQTNKRRNGEKPVVTKVKTRSLRTAKTRASRNLTLAKAARRARLIEAIDKSAITLQKLASAAGDQGSSRASIVATAAALRSMRMIVSALSVGECERAEPFSDLRYVQRTDGLYICCGHKPQHCTKIK